MTSFPGEVKDNLVFFSDPKLNFKLEASFGAGPLLVEGNEKTRPGLDLLEPKLYVGTASPSFGVWRLLQAAAGNVGAMDGVGGSECAPKDAETGNVNPELLLEERIVLLGSGLLMEMDVRIGLIPETGSWGLFSILRASDSPPNGNTIAVCCPLL